MALNHFYVLTTLIPMQMFSRLQEEEAIVYCELGGVQMIQACVGGQILMDREGRLGRSSYGSGQRSVASCTEKCCVEIRGGTGVFRATAIAVSTMMILYDVNIVLPFTLHVLSCFGTPVAYQMCSANIWRWASRTKHVAE
jgi:hypothetical protein